MSPSFTFRRRASALASVVLGMALGVPSVVSAQQAGAAAQGTAVPTVQELQRRIDTLEAQIAELTALVKAATAAPAPAGAPSPPPAPAPIAPTPSLDSPHDVTYGVNLDTYYLYNFNRPVGRVNLLRAYDVLSNNFSLNQADVLLERAPDLAAGRRFGGRLDLMWGQATETLQGSLSNEPRPWVYRNLFQAYGTYVAPIGSGLTVDFGKWASSLGLEGNYTKDQMNYSRSYWFNFLPFYHMGARVNYKLNDAVALNYWVTNGTQQTEEFNNFKDQFVVLVLTPTKALTWNVQYYLGQEHPDVQQIQTPGAPDHQTQKGLSITPVAGYFRGKLQVYDSYATWQASPATTFAAEGDFVASQSARAADSRVFGGALYARHQLAPNHAIAARGEFLRDRGGLFTGTTQSVKETTFTYDYKPSEGFLVRAEFRRDFTTIPFFLTSGGPPSPSQNSLTLGMVWWWGTKRSGW
jgi:hypothetical protein